MRPRSSSRGAIQAPQLQLQFGGLGETYTVYPKLIGNLVVGFLFVLVELFFARVTDDALRPNID